MNSSLLCSPAVPLEALGSWEPIHSCPYPFPLLGEDREAITRVGNLTSLTLAMEGENLGDSALETWPGKVTKSETAKQVTDTISEEHTEGGERDTGQAPGLQDWPRKNTG